MSPQSLLPANPSILAGGENLFSPRPLISPPNDIEEVTSDTRLLSGEGAVRPKIRDKSQVLSENSNTILVIKGNKIYQQSPRQNV